MRRASKSFSHGNHFLLHNLRKINLLSCCQQLPLPSNISSEHSPSPLVPAPSAPGRGWAVPLVCPFSCGTMSPAWVPCAGCSLPAAGLWEQAGGFCTWTPPGRGKTILGLSFRNTDVLVHVPPTSDMKQKQGAYSEKTDF